MDSKGRVSPILVGQALGRS